MKTVPKIIMAGAVAAMLACGNTGGDAKSPAIAAHATRDQAGTQTPEEAVIIQKWQGDFPVDQLELLPEGQRDKGVGYISAADTFAGVWQAFQPGKGVPSFDFGANLVLFVRNIQFYNRINIGKVQIKGGIAEVLTMETLSARPIEDKVAMSMVAVARDGITGLRTGDDVIKLK